MTRPSTVVTIDRATLQRILDLINPLHGDLDRQTHDEKIKSADLGLPPDYRFDTGVLAEHERGLTDAVVLLEAALKESERPRVMASWIGRIEESRNFDEAIRYLKDLWLRVVDLEGQGPLTLRERIYFYLEAPPADAAGALDLLREAMDELQ